MSISSVPRSNSLLGVPGTLGTVGFRDGRYVDSLTIISRLSTYLVSSHGTQAWRTSSTKARRTHQCVIDQRLSRNGPCLLSRAWYDDLEQEDSWHRARAPRLAKS